MISNVSESPTKARIVGSLPTAGLGNAAVSTVVTDDEALAAFHKLASVEGIIPALESSHAIAEAIKVAPTMTPEQIIVVNLSGRGDKDVAQVAALEAGK